MRHSKKEIVTKSPTVPSVQTELSPTVLREKVNEILSLRLDNERVIQFAIQTGLGKELETEGSICAETVREMSSVMSKISPTESLFKIAQVLDGNPTDIVMSKEEVDRKLEMVVSFEGSGSLARMEELIKRMEEAGRLRGGQSGEVIDIVPENTETASVTSSDQTASPIPTA